MLVLAADVCSPPLRKMPRRAVQLPLPQQQSSRFLFSDHMYRLFFPRANYCPHFIIGQVHAGLEAYARAQQAEWQQRMHGLQEQEALFRQALVEQVC